MNLILIVAISFSVQFCPKIREPESCLERHLVLEKCRHYDVAITVRFVGSEKTLRELSQLDFPSGNIHDPKDPNLKPIAQQKILDNLDQLSTADNSTIDQFNQVLKLLTQVSLIAQKSPNNLPHKLV